MIDSTNNISISNLNSTAPETNNQFPNLDIENINNNRNHYSCTQCFKFPYI